MQNQITPSSPELVAADKALRRAAANVKKQAEQQGTPYVVYRESSAGQLLNQSSQNKKWMHCKFVAYGKDSVAGKPVFNGTVTLPDAWQK